MKSPRIAFGLESYLRNLKSAGRGRFTTAVELKEASQLTLSLLYHMAAQRDVKNPMEEDNIVGITNYLDLGLQVYLPVYSVQDLKSQKLLQLVDNIQSENIANNLCNVASTSKFGRFDANPRS